MTLLSRALAVYRQAGNHFFSVRLLLDRALAHAAAGELEDEERVLAAGIEEYETQRTKVIGEQLRISYFDQAREISGSI